MILIGQYSQQQVSEVISIVLLDLTFLIAARALYVKCKLLPERYAGGQINLAILRNPLISSIPAVQAGIEPKQSKAAGFKLMATFSPASN